MQMITARGIGIGIQCGGILLNGILLFVYLVAHESQSGSGVAENRFGFLSRVLFLFGIMVAVLVASIGWKIRNHLIRAAVFLVATLWNQSWLLAYVVSLIPFKLP